MKHIIFFIGTLLLFLSLIIPGEDPPSRFDGMSTADVLVELGDTVIARHLPDTSLEKVSVQRGAQFVNEGQAKLPSWGVTPRISPYFQCTSCHNLKAETPSPTLTDPEIRLDYVVEHQMPYLQGSPLYGLVSRYSFYNGDYQKKYGDLAKKAHKDIRESLQLCAVECAQGRKLRAWELESILAYLWTIDIPFSELQLSKEELVFIENSLQEIEQRDTALALIRSKYITAYPATFIDPPKDRKEGNPYPGSAERGKMIYTHSCLHCHEDKRYSLYDLDTSYMSLNQLARRMPTYHEESVYQVSRYGTQPLRGKGAYMPNYTEEKLSRRQMADLRAYIFSKIDQ